MTDDTGTAMAAVLAAAAVLALSPGGPRASSRWPVPVDRVRAQRRRGPRSGRSPTGRSRRGSPHQGPGHRFVQRSRAPVTDVPATVVMELVAAALVAGLPGWQAVATAAEASGDDVRASLAKPLDAWRLGIPAERAWTDVDADFAPLARALVLAERTGASAAVLLAGAAHDARAARQRRALVAARRLGVQLVLPLGLTTLPAFVLWGVVPVVLGLAGQLLERT